MKVTGTKLKSVLIIDLKLTLIFSAAREKFDFSHVFSLWPLKHATSAENICQSKKFLTPSFFFRFLTLLFFYFLLLLTDFFIRQ